MAKEYDFGGWATVNNIKCSDGRTIMKDAFKHCDGQIVPLVWSHQHSDPLNVLGHALLENRERGVYAYCSFNDTPQGQSAKEAVKHGDINALSIYANKLQQNGGNVLHGFIREVSLVMAGANPEAVIDSVMAHSIEGAEDETVFYVLMHSDEDDDTDTESEETTSTTEESEQEENETNSNEKETEEMSTNLQHADGERTVKDVFDELTDEQKNVVYAIVGQAVEEALNENGGNEDMKHNLFDTETYESDDVLMHADMEAIFGDAKRYGSLKDSVLSHGIEDIEWLFPEDHLLDTTPKFIDREQGWVTTVMNGVHHVPFARIKSMFADIREDEARAKGYIKGKMKKEEFFSLLKRSTSPCTVYKKQKLDRDDVIDITSFDVVAWLKAEMRAKLDEEIARAVLIGDGRLASDDDKIKADCIRPIYSDDDLFTIKGKVNVAANATSEDVAKAFIKQAIRSQIDYMGSGNLTCFMSKETLTEILLLTDGQGRDLYTDAAAVAKKLGVNKIVTVPFFKTQKGVDGGDLLAVIVDLNDYDMGADKGGAVNMFDDFDIDFNQMKYLIETRCSGALTVPYSAIALELNRAA